MFLFINIFGLTAFYIALPLWPILILFLRFFFWSQRILRLLKRSFINFIRHFSQENLIILITCFIVYIEVLRITIRFVTLAFRLIANILGGHLIIELAISNSGNLFVLIALFSYELFVAIIQATIFRILIFYYTVEALEKY